MVLNKDKKLELQNDLIKKLSIENEKLKEALEEEKVKPKDSIREAKNMLIDLEEKKNEYEKLIADLEELKLQYQQKISEVETIKNNLRSEFIKKYGI